MPPKSNLEHVTQLADLDFLSSKSMRADFSAGNVGLQLQIEAHAPGVYRVRCAKPDELLPEKANARARARAQMLLAREEAVGELAVSSVTDLSHEGWRIEQGDIALELTRSSMHISVWRNDDLVFSTVDGATLGLAEGDAPVWQFCAELDGDDLLYGAGESPGQLDRNGSHLVTGDAAARALPLVWSTRGWGLYLNTLSRVEHDFGATDAGQYQLTLHDEIFDLFIFIGEPAEIINQYTALTGRAGQPGLPLMGVWLDQASGQSVDEILQVAQNFRTQQWGLDVVNLAPPALNGFQTDKPAFEWDASRITDMRELAGRCEEATLQLAGPTFPGVLADTDLFSDWEDRGWLLINDDSEALVLPGIEATGGRPFGLLDLTHKDVYKLWVERQRQSFEDGLVAPSCNAQFDIPDDITARGGESGALLRTLYPMLVRQALFDAVAGHKTPQEGVVCSADLFPSVQRFAWQTGPRTGNNWQAMEHTLRTALSLGNSSVPVQMHALGSAVHPTDDMTPELYVRWLAMCVFSGNFSFQALPGLLPSSFDEATQELVRHWLQWRYRLVPYVLGIIEEAVRTGQPVQRSMALAFPTDYVAQQWDTQYMLGPALLVAPVVQPGNKVQVYLPAGDAWWDLNTGWRYEGGTTWTAEVGLDSLPLFGREGHMLCLGPTVQHSGDFNSARILDEVWMFGMPEHSPVVMRNKIRVMQMQGSSYIKGLEGLRILPSEGLEVKRRGAEVRISRAR